MTTADGAPDVVHDERRRRFAIPELDAELTYRVVDARMVIDHTEVPVRLRRQGVGGRLVQAAVAHATRAGLTVVPACSFARHWMNEHPREAGGGGGG